MSTALLQIGQIISRCNHPAIYKNTEKNIAGLLGLLTNSLFTIDVFGKEVNLGWLAPAVTGLGLLQWQYKYFELLQEKFVSTITKNIELIKPTTACMLFHAFSRLALTEATTGCIALLAETIKPTVTTLAQRQLGNVFFACAVMSANGKAFDLVGSVLQEITRRLRAITFSDPVLVHQVFLAASYFSQQNSQQNAQVAATIVSVLKSIVEQNMQNETQTNIATMSYFQKKYTNFLREYYPTLRVEQLINGLLVDIVLPNGVIVQIDGPKHFLHGLDSQPIPTATENFHNALLRNHTVVHVPYFEADQLRDPKEIHTYLNSKLPADKKLPEFDPRKHPTTQTSFGLSSTSQSASTSDAEISDLTNPPNLDTISFRSQHVRSTSHSR